jgi:hypothetical protein
MPKLDLKLVAERSPDGRAHSFFVHPESETLLLWSGLSGARTLLCSLYSLRKIVFMFRYHDIQSLEEIIDFMIDSILYNRMHDDRI